MPELGVLASHALNAVFRSFQKAMLHGEAMLQS